MLNDLAAFAIAFATAYGLGPRLIAFLKRVKAGQRISTDVQQHMAKQGTPTMGGLLMLLGVFLGGIACPDTRGWVVVLAFVSFGYLGFLDDYLSLRRGRNLGLKARQKLAGQVVLSLLFVGLLKVLEGRPVTAESLAGVLMAAFMVVFLSNAVNLADGLDGLAGGLSLMAFLVTGVLLQRQGSGLAPVAFAVAGSCAGFLKHNLHPAKVFMGDTGSLALGAGLAFCLMGLAGGPGGNGRYLIMPLIGLVFTAELLSVVIQVASFKTTHRRVFKMTPIHHHFELLGWSERQIVTRFWLVGLVAGLGATAWAWSWLPLGASR
ncbi:MAG TPA: phospho-N-acetylmuramoyl-pentapeptide-transferase [Armatimonadota bacterium]|jgi:phospho-N-acetylmuramoyl-pentapeptide-transferase